MIYLISGTSRSGKTLIAEKMMTEYKIPYLSLDWLIMGFTNGIPEYGIHDKLWPNEIAEKFWPFLKAMLENMLWSKTTYIIEGEAILPELIHEFLKKYPNNIRTCFVGYSKVDLKEKVKAIYQYSSGKNDWLTNESNDYVENHISNMVDYSKKIEKDCKQYDLKYFDTSRDFIHVIDNVRKYLLEKE